MRLFCSTIIVLLSTSGGVLAQQPAPAGASLAALAGKRFPQPVRVRDLINRTVLQPLESQPVLGRVAGIVRSDDGAVKVVVAYGGLFGIGHRLIEVPADAMVLLGANLEILDFTPAQLSDLPTFDTVGSMPIGPDDMIRVGLARPSH